MKGLLLSISILLSAWLVFTIQQTHFNLGYIMAAVLIALHFFVVMFFSTSSED
jgi:hypothetical protein